MRSANSKAGHGNRRFLGRIFSLFAILLFLTLLGYPTIRSWFLPTDASARASLPEGAKSQAVIDYFKSLDINSDFETKNRTYYGRVKVAGWIIREGRLITVQMDEQGRVKRTEVVVELTGP